VFNLFLRESLDLFIPFEVAREVFDNRFSGLPSITPERASTAVRCLRWSTKRDSGYKAHRGRRVATTESDTLGACRRLIRGPGSTLGRELVISRKGQSKTTFGKPV
jgi:hypothetical protein